MYPQTNRTPLQQPRRAEQSPSTLEFRITRSVLVPLTDLPDPWFEELKAYSRRARRILLVQDDSPLRRKLLDLLLSWGYEVETAAEGFDALRKLPVFDPLVLMCDLKCSRMPAAHLVRRARHGVPDVTCIVMTESPDSAEAAEAIRQGASILNVRWADLEQIKAPLEYCLAFPPST